MRFRKTFLLCCVTICAKTGLARYLVDVTALWHASKVFESSLNNLKLFFSIPGNWIRIIQSFILKEKQVLTQAGCVNSQGQLKTFRKLL